MKHHERVIRADYEPSAWMRAQVTAAVSLHQAGDYIECGHAETGPFAFVDSSMPNTRLCIDCLAASDRPVPYCDRCGDSGDLQVWGARGGTTLILVVLCHTCLAAEGVEDV